METGEDAEGEGEQQQSSGGGTSEEKNFWQQWREELRPELEAYEKKKQAAAGQGETRHHHHNCTDDHHDGATCTCGNKTEAVARQLVGHLAKMAAEERQQEEGQRSGGPQTEGDE